MAIFFSKMLILVIFFQKLIFLSPNFSSNLTIFYPFKQFFIKLWWFRPKSGWKCCTFYVIGATRSINENLQKKHRSVCWTVVQWATRPLIRCICDSVNKLKLLNNAWKLKMGRGGESLNPGRELVMGTPINKNLPLFLCLLIKN
jgi:hypothetical protein